jgi:hypothetical protein
MRLITVERRGGIALLGALPLLVLMLSVGIGHADSWKRGANGERGSVRAWAGKAHANARGLNQEHVRARNAGYDRGERQGGRESWQGRGDSGGRRYKPEGGRSGGWDNSRGDHRSGGGSSGGYSRGGYGGGSGGYSGGYTRYRSGSGYRGGYSGGYSYRRYARAPYYYSRPRSYVRVGIGLGYPRYGYYAPRRVIVARPVRTLVITNQPPSGCYYYDSYCDYRFDCLDDFYEHMEDCDHDATLEVIDGGGQCIGTYGYVEGQWSVMN